MYEREATLIVEASLFDRYGDPIESGTATVELSKDSAAYTAMTNSLTHVDEELWTITLTSTETNCDKLRLRIEHDDLDSTMIISDSAIGSVPPDIDEVVLKEAIRQGYDPERDVIVKWADTDAERGTNLKTAYTTAKALTPYSSALSSVNRARVLIPKGWYDLTRDEEEGEYTGLYLNVDYVDLIALVPERAKPRLSRDIDYRDGTTSLEEFRPGGTVLYCSSPTTDLIMTTVKQNTSDVRMNGFAIANFSTGIGNRALYVSCDTNEGSIYTELYCWNRRPYGANYGGTTFEKHVAGLWINCDANSYSWRIGTGSVTQSIFSPTMYQCIGGHSSFIGDTSIQDETTHIASGSKLYHCEVIGQLAASSTAEIYEGHGFGGCTGNGAYIDDTCEFWYCKSGSRSYGLGVKNEGKYYYCTGGVDSFAGTTNVSWDGNFAGYAYKCQGLGGSFGGNHSELTNGKCTGVLIDCTILGSDEPHRLEGATLINSELTMGTSNQDCVTLLDSNSKIHNCTLLVVEGGTGIPINAATARSVSAMGNHYNNVDQAVTGLGENVTNVGTTDVIPPSASTIADQVDTTLSVSHGADEWLTGEGTDIDPNDIEAIKLKTDTIVAGNVTAISPVTDDLDITIVAGDSYLTSIGRELSWSNSSGDWCAGDLTDATVTFIAVEADGTTILTIEGAVVAATGTQVISVDLSEENSLLFTREGSHYKYQVQLTKNDCIETVVEGDIHVTLHFDTTS